MSLKRSVRRKHQLKQRKSLKKGLKRALNATLGMPSSCSICSKAFDKESDISAWIVNFSDSTVRLTCPDCSSLDT